MSKSQAHGIAGLLDRILTASNAQLPQPPGTRTSTSSCRPESVGSHPARRLPMNARRGRPLGKPSTPQAAKEKVTLRITATLIAVYRDWSWEAHSQLSQLVEQALADYHDRRRSQRRSAR